MSDTKRVAPAELDALIDHMLVGNPTPSGRRLLGIEFEHLILERGSGRSAPVEFSVELMARLVDHLGAEPVREHDLIKGLHSAEFDMSLEPGGQIEVATPPMPDMEGIGHSITAGTTAIEQLLASSDYELVCLGHAPVTPVEEIGILPRERYRIMDRVMPTRGPLSRNMMRATAGFQITYDVADRADAGRKMALLYRLSPLLLALTANSRMIAGADSGYASFRHHVWWETDRERVGVPPGCLHPETAIDGYIAYAKGADLMFLQGEDDVLAGPEIPLSEAVAQGMVSEADVDLHLTGLFPFVRLRNYMEIRCFDAVPWPLARSVMALVSGLIYCNQAYAAAETFSRQLAIEDPAELRALHESAARHGLDAPAPNGGSFRDLALEAIAIAGNTLGGPNCDWSTPGDLEAVTARATAQHPG